MEDENELTYPRDLVNPVSCNGFISSGGSITFAPVQPADIRYQANVYLGDSNVSLQEQLSTLEQRIQELLFKLEQQSLRKTEEEMSQFFETGDSNEIG